MPQISVDGDSTKDILCIKDGAEYILSTSQHKTGRKHSPSAGHLLQRLHLSITVQDKFIEPQQVYPCDVFDLPALFSPKRV